LLFGHLDAPLDIANGIKVLADLGAVVRTDLRQQPGDLLGYIVKNAAVSPGPGEALVPASAVAASE
jgi:hypothetical protein